jgi:hypothetical protein
MVVMIPKNALDDRERGPCHGFEWVLVPPATVLLEVRVGSQS